MGTGPNVCWEREYETGEDEKMFIPDIWKDKQVSGISDEIKTGMQMYNYLTNANILN